MSNPFIGGIIMVAISAVIMAQVYLYTVHSVNTSATGWSTAEASMWGILGLIGIVGFLYGVLNVFGIV